jgi:hypothetical protein
MSSAACLLLLCLHALLHFLPIVLLARRINVDAAFLGHSSSTKAAASATAHAQDASKGSNQQLKAAAGSRSSNGSSSVNGNETCRLAAAVSRLVELDVSDAVQLSACCLLQLLAWGGNLKRLGASGCTTLAAAGVCFSRYCGSCFAGVVNSASSLAPRL